MKFSMLILTGCLFISSFAFADCQPEKSKKQFNRCIACHSLKQGEHKMGPSLHNIIGRQIATQQKFNYSPAMKSKNFVWSNEMLSQFLTNPVDVVPGTVMPFAGIKKQKQRDGIICYLNSLNKLQLGNNNVRKKQL